MVQPGRISLFWLNGRQSLVTHAYYILLLKGCHLFFCLFSLGIAREPSDLQVATSSSYPSLERFGTCVKEVAASISEPWLALRVGNPPQKSKHQDGLFWKYLEKDNVWPLPSMPSPLCTVCNDPGTINWTLRFKDKDGILLLGNLVTPINLCLTNPLKIWCSTLQLRAASKDSSRCCNPNTFINYLFSDVYQGALGQQEWRAAPWVRTLQLLSLSHFTL